MPLAAAPLVTLKAPKAANLSLRTPKTLSNVA
eukprot:COSAG05_NODE_8654_length_683_cov_1.135274_1_plen_31_part_10